MMTELTVSRHCANDMHLFCQDFGVCGCTVCHLGPCAVCGATDLQKMQDDPLGETADKICVPCYRVRVKRTPPTTTACDTCGAPNAFRNPKHRRNEYLCMPCHLKTGESIIMHSSGAHLVMPCTTFDINDPRHDWRHIRGNRFRCPCGADVTSKELGDKLRREYLGPGD